MALKIYLNGKFVPKEKAVVSVFDHGLLYGDGVFEGIRSYNGCVFKLDEHVDRLYNSAQAIALRIPLSKQQMKEKVLQALKLNRLRDAYIRLVVTRGKGDLGLDPVKCPAPFVFIIADKIALYPDALYRKGLEIITVSVRRNNPEAINPMIKSLNYLNNILAKIEANNAGMPEALLLNSGGYVSECTGENVFAVRDGILMTPHTSCGILEGITRKIVIELAEKLNLPVKESVMTRHDLYTASECFLCGTAAELVSVVKIDGRVIGNGKPGRWTVRLSKAYKELVKSMAE